MHAGPSQMLWSRLDVTTCRHRHAGTVDEQHGHFAALVFGLNLKANFFVLIAPVFRPLANPWENRLADFAEFATKEKRNARKST
jgi:hypothetical protein